MEGSEDDDKTERCWMPGAGADTFLEMVNFAHSDGFYYS